MNERDKLITVVRVIGVCLVVLGHSLTNAVKNANPELSVLSDFIYSFHMFLFFYVSGFLFEKGIGKYENDKRRFIANKAKLLIVPYISLSVIGYSLGFITNGLGLPLLSQSQLEFRNILKAFILNINHIDTHIWYIYFLFFIFLVNILFPRILMKKISVIILILTAGLYGVLSLTGVRINTFLYYMIPFIAGRMAQRENGFDSIVQRNKAEIIILSFVFILSNLLMMYIDSISGISSQVIGQLKIGLFYEIKLVAGLSGTHIVIYLAGKLSKTKIVSKCKTIDNYSYAIYLLHQPYITTICMAVCYKIVGTNLFCVVICFISCFAAPIVATKYILRKNKFLHALIIGNR